MDGVEESVLQQSGTLDYHVGTGFEFGSVRNSSGSKLQGDLDEVAVHDRPLTATEIAEHASF